MTYFTLRARYLEIVKRLHSLVHFKSLSKAPEFSSHALRAGINLASLESSATTDLLIAKGYFTKEEWLKKVVAYAEREADNYETPMTLQ